MMLRKIGQRLCHLFGVKHLRPSRITAAFALLQLRLHIDQQAYPCMLNLRLLSFSSFLRLPFSLFIQRCAQRFFRILLAQRIKPLKSNLSRCASAHALPILNLPAFFSQCRKKRIEALRLLPHDFVNGCPHFFPLRLLGSVT